MALYTEMAEQFSQLYFFASPRDPNPPHAFRHPAYLAKANIHGLVFSKETYETARAKTEFQGLKERGSINDFYAWLDRIQNPREHDEVLVLVREAVFWVVQQATDLDRKLLVSNAPNHAKADMKQILSETPQSLHDNWLAFGQ